MVQGLCSKHSMILPGRVSQGNGGGFQVDFALPVMGLLRSPAQGKPAHYKSVIAAQVCPGECGLTIPL